MHCNNRNFCQQEELDCLLFVYGLSIIILFWSKAKLSPMFGFFFRFSHIVHSYTHTVTSPFICYCFPSAFTSADIIFYKFLELHSTLSKKIFLSETFLFYRVYCPIPRSTFRRNWRKIEKRQRYACYNSLKISTMASNDQ